MQPKICSFLVKYNYVGIIYFWQKIVKHNWTLTALIYYVHVLDKLF